MSKSQSPPSVVYVGHYDYAVREKRNHDLLGETMNDQGRIIVRRDQSACKRDTVVHELLHAILFASGFGLGMEHDAEEALVRSLAPWILAVLRDNSDLVDFLLEA